jgi:hypothetical protein
LKILLGLFFSLIGLSAIATSEKLGMGLMLGNPTGLIGKYWPSDDHAVDAGIGLSFGRRTDLNIHSDYLLHKKSAFYFNDVHPLDLYYGLGGRMEFAHNIELGVRVPVGVAHMMHNKPADLFAEVVPIFDFIGRRGVELSIAFGARYYFR